MRATRGWNDHEWNTATARLAAHGWLDAHGRLTNRGRGDRETLELDTDRHCQGLWVGLPDDTLRRLGEPISPIHAAFAAAGTFAQSS